MTRGAGPHELGIGGKHGSELASTCFARQAHGEVVDARVHAAEAGHLLAQDAGYALELFGRDPRVVGDGVRTGRDGVEVLQPEAGLILATRPRYRRPLW